MLDLPSLAAFRRRLDRGSIKEFNSFLPIVELLFLLAICITRDVPRVSALQLLLLNLREEVLDAHKHRLQEVMERQTDR